MAAAFDGGRPDAAEAARYNAAQGKSACQQHTRVGFYQQDN
jgi:hypothetical protein